MRKEEGVEEEKKTNKDFDNEDDGGEEVEETISSEVA